MLEKRKNIEPESVIINRRTALLDQYPTCCSCNKKFPESTREYYYIVLVKSGVNIPSEPCCKECISRFTGIPIDELWR